jgi:O-antigen/teichoic acid export membrane protein
MGVGLLVGVWVARYLGPAQFGQLSYAIAFIGLFASIAALGLSDVVARDIVRDPDDAYTTLGTTFVLQVIGSFVAVFCVVASVYMVMPDDALTRLVVIVFSFTLVFRSTDVVKYWFESQVQSRYAVWIENLTMLCLAGVRVYLIMAKAPLLAFVLAMLAESMVAAIGLLWTYHRTTSRGLLQWKFEYQRAVTLVRESWPYIFIGIANMLYARVDQMMIPSFLNNTALGLYSASIKITAIWLFVPVVISASLLPSIVRAKAHSHALYELRLEQLYRITCLIALPLAVFVSLFAKEIIHLLFGSGYLGGATVLSIRIWETVFAALGVVSGKWVVTEGLQRLSLLYSFCGMTINVVGNAFMIPRCGIEGAAMVSVFSIFCTIIVMPLIFQPTRVDALRRIKALFFFWLPISIKEDTRHWG